MADKDQAELNSLVNKLDQQKPQFEIEVPNNAIVNRSVVVD